MSTRKHVCVHVLYLMNFNYDNPQMYWRLCVFDDIHTQSVYGTHEYIMKKEREREREREREGERERVIVHTQHV